MKRVYKIFIFFGVFVSLYLYACLVFTPKSVKDYGGNNYYAGRLFEAEDENTIDVVAFGNSDLYNSLNSQALFGEYGYTIYNCGVAKANLQMAENYFREIRKKQKIKLVIFESDFIFENRNEGKVIQKLGQARFLVSPFVYHAKWKEMKLKDFYTFPKKEIDHFKGYRFSKTINKHPIKDPNYMHNNKKAVISRKNIQSLKKIIEICKENNIDMMMFESPTYTSWNLKKSNQINQICVENNIKFIDFNLMLDEIEFDSVRDYRDKGNHLNYYGAMKVTKYLGKFISENFNLENHMNQEGYEKWYESYQIYLKEEAKYKNKR